MIILLPLRRNPFLKRIMQSGPSGERLLFTRVNPRRSVAMKFLAARSVARVRLALLGWTGEGARPYTSRTMTPYSFIIASIVEYSWLLSFTSTYGLLGFRLLTM